MHFQNYLQYDQLLFFSYVDFTKGLQLKCRYPNTSFVYGLDNVFHPMHEAVAEVESSFSARLLHARCTDERYRRSFLPAAVRLLDFILCFFGKLHAPSACHFAAGTLEFPT